MKAKTAFWWQEWCLRVLIWGELFELLFFLFKVKGCFGQSMDFKFPLELQYFFLVRVDFVFLFLHEQDILLFLFKVFVLVFEEYRLLLNSFDIVLSVLISFSEGGSLLDVDTVVLELVDAQVAVVRQDGREVDGSRPYQSLREGLLIEFFFHI